MGETDNYSIPYSKEFGGEREDKQPFTGNGFTCSAEQVIPEYVSNGVIPYEGYIYRIHSDEKEEPIAYYSKGKFVLYNKNKEV